ncbi:MAG: hypothetical protein ACRDYZ_11410 [Acidimicrobiales bacterium]
MALGAEWLFVRHTGALQFPAPPSSASASLVAQVAAAHHELLVVGILLGAIVRSRAWA